MTNDPVSLDGLRELVDNFRYHDKNKGPLVILDTARTIARLSALPDYVGEASYRGLTDPTMSDSHYKSILDKWGARSPTTKKIMETPEMVFYRVALLAANGIVQENPSKNKETVTKELFYKMLNREIFPNTPYMANAGHDLIYERIKPSLERRVSPEIMADFKQEGDIRSQLFACFVLEILDSRESIFKALSDAAFIHAAIGGTGFNFSYLRPGNETIQGTGGITDGPIAFMAMFSHVLGKTMNQGGKREGANMFMLDINHPDIMRFLYCKRQDGEISSANLSTAIDHDFMTALKEEGEGRFYLLRNPHYNPQKRPHVPEFYSKDQLSQALGISYANKKAKLALELGENGEDVLSPWLPEGLDEEFRAIGKIKDGKVYLDARKVLRHMAFGSWFNGEPGIIFIGNINDYNPTHPRHYRNFLLEQKDPEAIRVIAELKEKDSLRRLEEVVDEFIYERDGEGRFVNLPLGVGVLRATNPCGEKPLLGDEACILGHINLEKILNVDTTESSGYRVNYERFKEDIRILYEILDNAIDQNHFTNPEIEKTQKSNRKIGMGFMGLANMLYRLELPYGSEEARKFIDELLTFWEKESDGVSFERGEKLGAFPNFKYSHHRNGKPKRNAIVRTLAPTGTTGFAAKTTGGIEPEYALAYTRTTVQGTSSEVFNPVLEEKLKKYSFFLNADDKKRFHEFIQSEGRGSLQRFTLIRGSNESDENYRIRTENLEKIKSIFVTTYDISAEEHLRMQAVVQNHTDDSISKTTNFGGNATVEDIESAIKLAYELGIKGVTFYRDGTRKDQPLQTKGSSLERKLVDPSQIDITELIRERLSRPRPNNVGGRTEKGRTPYGDKNEFLTLNWERDEKDRNIAPYEAFVSIGKGGQDLDAIAEGYGRLISIALKVGVQPEIIVEQLAGIGGGTQQGLGEEKVTSLPDAIARAIAVALKKEEIYGRERNKGYRNGNHRSFRNGISGNLCPICGKALNMQEGCEKCNCGFSKCN